MKIYKNPTTGMYHIWAEDIHGNMILERYLYYTKREAIKLFRKAHPASTRKTKGITNVNWCLGLLQ